MYVTHWHSLVGYATLLLGNRDLAKDVVQDVFLRAWGRDIYDSLDDPMPYLMRSVYNGSMDVFRSGAGSMLNTDAALIEHFDPDKNEVIRKIYRSDIRNSIRHAVGELPAKCRQVFVLRYLDGFSAAETAEILGISVSTVNNHVLKALKALRRFFLQYK